MIKHIVTQPFIFATGLAALIHSTWSLGTLFAGTAPASIASWEFWFWLVPALLIAFAMDVGQISTSAQIRERGMTFARGTTFVVFALATYYLQWLYIAHHMPALDLAAGVSELHRPLTLFLRDMGMWIIPALLPLSTLLYTFSADHATPVVSTRTEAKPADVVQSLMQTDNTLTLSVPNEPPMANEWEAMVLAASDFVATCEECGWQKTYTTEAGRNRGLNAHRLSHTETIAASNGTHA